MSLSRADFDSLIRPNQLLMRRLATLNERRNEHVKWLCYKLLAESRAILCETDAIHDGQFDEV